MRANVLCNIEKPPLRGYLSVDLNMRDQVCLLAVLVCKLIVDPRRQWRGFLYLLMSFPSILTSHYIATSISPCRSIGLFQGCGNDERAV